MKIKVVASALLLSALTGQAHANWAVNVGPIYAAPKESSGSLDVIEQVAGLQPGSTAVAVNDDWQLGLTIDYNMTPNWALQLIAATPFSHNIRVAGSAVDGLQVGKTKHLPPTLLAQYHFTEFHSNWQPFIGVGLNYTNFFNSKADEQLVSTLQALEVSTSDDHIGLSLSDSWGLALQAGVNVQVTPDFGIHAMVSKIDISTTARVSVNGDTIQSVGVDIDPVVAMVGVRWQF